MARTIAVWQPSGIGSTTVKLMLDSDIAAGTYQVTETITVTEHATVKRLYTGTVTASAGQYHYNFLSSSSFVGGGVIYVGSTDATTYQESNVPELNAAQSEPTQGTPSATASPLQKIAYLFKAWRNRKTQTATQYTLYNDDATTIDHKATVSDDGTTTTIGEVATGP